MGGNGYNHQSFQQKNSGFLPILCSRPSIKDVQLPRWRHHRSASFSFSDDPCSPRVSCMGQVKRTNRVIAFPTSCRFTAAKPASAAAAATNLKYHKLRRLFAGKGLAPPAASVSHSSGKNATASSARRVKLNNSDNNYNTSDGGDRVKYAAAAEEVNIAELDPPLPVVKRAADGRREEVNLWKRRSGGVALKSLQLRPAHQPSNNPHCLAQPTTV